MAIIAYGIRLGGDDAAVNRVADSIVKRRILGHGFIDEIVPQER